MLRERFRHADAYREYVERAEANEDLWREIGRRAEIPEATVRRVEGLPGDWHLLVLAEDWCEDAVNTVPVLARLAAEASNLDLRILDRDENPDLMDAHLSDGSRSIPVVMVLDDEYVERGWWGPRPGELQEWVLEEGLGMPSGERYKVTRRWYARDRGCTTLDEVIRELEKAAAEGAFV